MHLKEIVTSKGEVLLYTGEPRIELLDELAAGPGDLWHSSLDQGFRGAFPELVYQTAVFWWFLNDVNQIQRSINWRINPQSFVIRKTVWEIYEGLSGEYHSNTAAALDFGYRLLRHGGGVPLYIEGLFSQAQNVVALSANDRYRFYRKNFKWDHCLYMLLKKSASNFRSEIKAFRASGKENLSTNSTPIVAVRGLDPLTNNPEVSVVIPTMSRQKYTLQLLNDYRDQTYSVKEIIVVDATPSENWEPEVYKEDYPFDLIVHRQKSKGSCRGRNEALNFCTGDYIIFADDDIRILPDFVENHLRFLQTYSADACTGLDVHADNHEFDLKDLKKALDRMGENRWKAGAAQNFNNANSCVKKEWVDKMTGNDINFDGGYGEDTDFGFRILKMGGILLYNPYSANLHLKPPAGGYRDWGLQASVLGKQRKKQAWELDHPVRFIRPVPSPTILYGIIKHYKTRQVKEYRSKYFFLYLFKGSKKMFLLRLLKLPYKQLQFNRSLFYARNLIKLGERF
ncbi:glycosyltransferase family 2 protein [Salinimicrobium sp. TH3]|uniref:glycosyltransferase family 2 protein n=1 Tax=Salinimicrobium sp. TH3 TaxID=2997342 RepID=UPI002273A26F|nr:glycosyltransferase family 2 protein [Salinimicrobium sp. TH3]MCY2687870.1 glycosyltransferase family 2 protein [Salinimicrobium sp. TH3]